MNKDQRSAAARKGWEIRRARQLVELVEFRERGRYEATIEFYLKNLARFGNVVIAQPAGHARIAKAVGGAPALELGELRVSLEQVTFIPREGLHPASMSYAVSAVAEILRCLPIGNWQGWRKGQDEHLSDCYTATIVRVITDERALTGPDYSDAPLLDVDPLSAIVM